MTTPEDPFLAEFRTFAEGERLGLARLEELFTHLRQADRVSQAQLDIDAMWKRVSQSLGPDIPDQRGRP